MASQRAVGATKQAVAVLEAAVARVNVECRETLGVRRLQSEPAPDELEEISGKPYDESMWSDAELGGFGAPDRRAP